MYDIGNSVEKVNNDLDITYDCSIGSVAGTIEGLGDSQSHDGEIAEIMLFSERFFDIQDIVLHHYPNARYGLATKNKFYAADGVEGENFGVFSIVKSGIAENIISSFIQFRNLSYQITIT
ncbi:MAG: hypothetical protein ACI9A7_001443 [Cyclobacteriaceae bacterium]